MASTKSIKLTIDSVKRSAGGARVRTHVRAGTSFSDSGIEMQKNDTTIAGDKYQTDTCHVDNYGRS